MKRWLFIPALILIITLFLLLVSPSSTAPVKAAGATKWQFNDNTYGGTRAIDGSTHAFWKQMSLTAPTGGSKEVTVPASQTGWWYFDQEAQTNVSFGTQTWRAEVHVGVDSTEETNTLTVEVWKVDPDNGSATRLAQKISPNTKLSTTLSEETLILTPVGVSQDIPIGWTIACMVKWGGSNGLKIGYNNKMDLENDSWCESPSSDPGFPFPEPATFILIPAGVAAVILAFIIINRRAKAARSS